MSTICLSAVDDCVSVHDIGMVGLDRHPVNQIAVATAACIQIEQRQVTALRLTIAGIDQDATVDVLLCGRTTSGPIKWPRNFKPEAEPDYKSGDRCYYHFASGRNTNCARSG